MNTAASNQVFRSGIRCCHDRLYRGKVAETPDEAHEIMRGLPEDRAKPDLHAAFEFFASQPNVKKERIGAIAWCWGR